MTPTILTVSGAYFPLLAPSPVHIKIEDIAHALLRLDLSLLKMAADGVERMEEAA